MAPPRGTGSNASERRFFLRSPLKDALRPELLPEDEQHALRVLRLSSGDRLWGLDGVGSIWPLVVRSAERRRIELEQAGDPEWEPRPGDAGTARPWIEVCCAVPRPNRQSDMIDRLTQLGLSNLSPVNFEQSATRELSAPRLEKLLRVAREACKQSRNLWLPLLQGPVALTELGAPGGAEVLLGRSGDRSLAEWAREARPRRVTVYAGPEGGLRDSERALLIDRGAVEVRLTSTTLRIETATELAVGTLNQA